MTPAVQISDYIDVREKARALGYEEPDGFCILPRHFETAFSADELLYESQTPTLRKLWRQAGAEAQPLAPRSERIPYISEKAAEWLLPTILITAAISQNPVVLNIIIGVISNFLADSIKRLVPAKARFNIVVEQEKSRRYKRITYEGDSSNLSELPEIIKAIADDE